MVTKMSLNFDQEGLMDIGSTVVLGGIVFAFALFAVVLMWGDFYSRNARQ